VAHRRILSLLLILSLASCGTTNHLDRYNIKGSTMYMTASIDPVPQESSSNNTNSDESIGVQIFTAIVVALFTSHPDATMRDGSIAGYFEDGFRIELDSVYWVRATDLIDSARFRLNVQITDCDLHEISDTNCLVRFSEKLTLTDIATTEVVLDEKRNIEVPLRYCGSTSDSISQSSVNLPKWKYQHIIPEEQLSALQCAAFDAGADLADSLANLSDRSRPKKD
jgi:hypothetical protein